MFGFQLRKKKVINGLHSFRFKTAGLECTGVLEINGVRFAYSVTTNPYQEESGAVFHLYRKDKYQWVQASTPVSIDFADLDITYKAG